MISIVVPVYRGVATLEPLYQKACEVLRNYDIEFIFVYDCGNPESWQTLLSLQTKYKNITLVRLGRNYGQHNATICGFGFINGEFIVTMDEDLQHDPADIPKLLQMQNEENS